VGNPLALHCSFKLLWSSPTTVTTNWAGRVQITEPLMQKKILKGIFGKKPLNLTKTSIDEKPVGECPFRCRESWRARADGEESF
jgi:hypothetical protein